jgi:ParB-like chromosome segregation protein Spo0J
MNQIAITSKPIKSLKMQKNNARVHSPEQIADIARSIQSYGFSAPVLIDPDGVVIAGHGRLQAARQLGMTHVPAITIDGLSPEQLRALTISDNAIADRGGWDAELLRQELEAIVMSGDELTGFTTKELEQLFKPVSIPSSPGPAFDESIAQDVEMVTCKGCGKEFPR